LKETWAFAVAKMLTDPIWWFYLFWLPRYLQETFHLSISTNRTPVVAVYVISIVGSVGGGYLSSAMLGGGRSLNVARKSALLICALMVLPVLYAPYATRLWVVVALVGLAAAGHQGWSANLFTLASDLFPKAAVGSMTGIGGMAGALAGAGFQLATGYIVRWANSYVPLFIVAGLAYLTALLVVHLLSPKLAPAKLD
jgi:ACS family hexuronate transporter-like MFS transporter